MDVLSVTLTKFFPQPSQRILGLEFRFGIATCLVTVPFIYKILNRLPSPLNYISIYVFFKGVILLFRNEYRIRLNISLPFFMHVLHT